MISVNYCLMWLTCNSFLFSSAVKSGTPYNDDLELLADYLTESWKKVGRRLKFEEEHLVGFHKENDEVTEKAFQMLLHWKRRDGSEATYQVLHDALCHHLVNQRDLAERFCCHETNTGI